MPIDTSIAMGYKPIQLADPMNQLAQIMQIKNSQQQMELGDVNLQQHKSALDDKNKLNALYAGSMNPDGTINRDTLMQNAAKQNLGSQIPGIRKGFYEADEAQGKVDKQKVDLIDSKLKQSRQYLDGVSTPEAYIAWHEANHSDPILGPVLAARGITAEQSRSRITAALQQPGGLQQLINESKVGTDKFTELNKPSVHTQNTGDRATMLTIPGMGGAPTVVSSAAISQSPDSRASVGASLANAAATREVAKATRDSANIQRDQATEMKLSDDYRAQSKSFQESTSAYRQLNATLDSATTSPAATLAAATKFMKILDPNSVVRESELGMALQSSGAIDRMGNYMHTLQVGKVLTPTQVADFRDISQKMYTAAATVQRDIDATYTNTAKSYNIRPENILQNLGQNDAKQKPASPAANSVKTPDGVTHSFQNPAAAAAFRKAAGL